MLLRYCLFLKNSFIVIIVIFFSFKFSVIRKIEILLLKNAKNWIGILSSLKISPVIHSYFANVIKTKCSYLLNIFNWLQKRWGSQFDWIFYWKKLKRERSSSSYEVIIIFVFLMKVYWFRIFLPCIYKIAPVLFFK